MSEPDEARHALDRTQSSDAGSSTSVAPEPATAPRGFWSRVAASVLLATTLVFAGLFARQLRLTFEQMQVAAAAMQRAGAVEAQYQAREASVTQAEQQVRQTSSLLALVADPAIQRWELQGASARGQVFYQPERSRLGLAAFDLPEPEAGSGYQAWVRTADGAVHSLGMLPSAQDGMRGLLVAAPTGSLSSVQLTLEPASGSKAPSGAVVLAGAPATVPVSPASSP